MKVFISWSGGTSHQVALALRDWLPRVIQAIDPWVSSEDIWKGQHWSLALTEELSKTKYAILCLTHNNLDSRWLNFEAGAIANLLDSRVIPFLFNMKSTQLSGPLALLQYATYEPDSPSSKGEMLKILQSINEAEGTPLLKETILIDAFDDQWGKLDETLGGIALSATRRNNMSDREPVTPSTDEVLATILDLVRTQQREMALFRQEVRRIQLVGPLGAPIRSREIPDDYTIPASVSLIEFEKVSRLLPGTYQNLSRSLDRSPTTAEIAEALEVNHRTVIDYLHWEQKRRRFEEAQDDGDQETE